MSKLAVFNAIKKWFTIKSLVNILFVMVLVVLFINPSAKALLIRGLMKVGLFQPDIPAAEQALLQSGDINFQDYKGKIVSLSSLKGKVVFINFWATWCPPCIAELPSINDLHQQLNADKRIVFLLVNTDNDFKKALPFMARHNYSLAVYAAVTVVPDDMLGGTIPTTVIIDKQGKMVFHREGTGDYTNTKFVAYLNKLVAQ
jgi:thiol-disulfide isomerase/thioredoxin